MNGLRGKGLLSLTTPNFPIVRIILPTLLIYLTLVELSVTGVVSAFILSSSMSPSPPILLSYANRHRTTNHHTNNNNENSNRNGYKHLHYNTNETRKKKKREKFSSSLKTSYFPGDIHKCKKMNYNKKYNNKSEKDDNEEDIDSYMYMDETITSMLSMEPTLYPHSEATISSLVDIETYCIDWFNLQTYVFSLHSLANQNAKNTSTGTAETTNTNANNTTSHNGNENENRDENNWIPMEALVQLAEQCDILLFQSSSTKSQKQQQCLSLELKSLISIVTAASPKNSSHTSDGVDLSLSNENNEEEDISYYEERVWIATLMALNQVESSMVLNHNDIYNNIKSNNNNTSAKVTIGRAPLLKDLIDCIPSFIQKGTLATLLLPKYGLNLRNLMWHGFVITLPRRWLSLCLLLSHTLNKSQSIQSSDTSQVAIPPSPQLPSFSTKMFCDNNCDGEITDEENDQISSFDHILNHGKALCSSLHSDQDIYQRQNTITTLKYILPPSHQSLFEAACNIHFNEYKCKSPILFTSITCVLLEHALRLQWCRQFESQHQDIHKLHRHAIAHNNQYYVTLDGHGQRDKHDLILYPTPSSTSKLLSANNSNGGNPTSQSFIQIIGPVTLAILTDFFASPPPPSSQQPISMENIRSAMAHGIYDFHLRR